MSLHRNLTSPTKPFETKPFLLLLLFFAFFFFKHSLLISQARNGFDQQMKEIWSTQKRCSFMPWPSYCSFPLQNGPFAKQLHILPAISQTFILSLLVNHCWCCSAKWHRKQGNLHDATWWSTIGLKLWQKFLDQMSINHYLEQESMFIKSSIWWEKDCIKYILIFLFLC